MDVLLRTDVAWGTDLNLRDGCLNHLWWVMVVWWVQSRDHLVAKMGKWKMTFVHDVMDLLAVSLDKEIALFATEKVLRFVCTRRRWTDRRSHLMRKKKCRTRKLFLIV